MAARLRLLGSAWQPLLARAVDALAAGGLELQALWPVPERRSAALERFGQLLDRVITWNARMDLTAARDERELVDLFLADALVLAAAGAQSDTEGTARWVDVGSGAGAPGLALALLRPGPAMTLVEPRQKRVAFLRSVAGSFAEIAGVSVVEGRSDVVSSREHDIAISRATFSPDQWLAEGARLARREVWVLLARAEAPALAGWRATRQIDYAWPLTGVAHRAIAFSPAESPGA
jgi:16S rRNA (guanine527-N7)-methyltransferase